MRCEFYLLPESSVLLFCLSHVASNHIGDSSGNMQPLYFDLHPCVNGLNGFLDLCD